MNPIGCNSSVAATSVKCAEPNCKVDLNIVRVNKPAFFDIPKTIYGVHKLGKAGIEKLLKNEIDYITGQLPEYKFKTNTVLNTDFGCVTYKLTFSRF